MGATSVIRLLSGLLTFTVVARLLGPASFGSMMVLFSVAVLAAMITNFGLVTYVLREVAAQPADITTILNEGLTLKLIVTGVVSGVALAASALTDSGSLLIFALLLWAALCDSFTEFLNAALRARNNFGVETKITSVAALSHAFIVVGLLLLSPTILAAAGGYALSRLFVLSMTVRSVARMSTLPRPAALSSSLQRLRGVKHYALDFSLQSLFGNIDSLVLNHFVGPVAVGIYQAGMRVFQSGVMVTQVMANVFLPRVASLQGNQAAFQKESARIQTGFLGIGLLFGAAIGLLADWIVALLFGAAYQQLATLLPFFGLLFYARFSAAAWGVILTADQQQAYRTRATTLHWLLVAAVTPWLIHRFGSLGWLLALIAGNAALAAMYAVRARHLVLRPKTTFTLSVLGALLFVPFLRLSA